MATTKVTTADFEAVVLKSTTPVLVDFCPSGEIPSVAE
jgi:thioredoxin 1